MKLLQRRRRANLSREDDEEAPVSKSTRPLMVGSTTRKDTTGTICSRNLQRQAKSLHFLVKPWLLACLFLVVCGARLFTSTTPNDNRAVQHLPPYEVNNTEATTSAIPRPPPTLPRQTPPKAGALSNTQDLETRVVVEVLSKKGYASSDALHGVSCSCWNTTAPPDCCERAIFRAHKFGTILVDTLVHSFRYSTVKLRINVKQFPKQLDNTTLPTTSDYRHVVVTRNWFDAIVSGYLYHKAGHECWVNAHGLKKRIVRRDDWDSQLTFHDKAQIPYPPRHNRSICTYLNEESQEDGMKALMDIALSKWYKGVVPYWNLVQERSQRDSQQHSLFICYEDLVDPFQQERVFHQILDWMFPTGEARNVSMSTDIKKSLEQQQQNQTFYSGGHATAHNPELRLKLRKLVEHYGRELFNDTVAASNAIFGCGLNNN